MSSPDESKVSEKGQFLVYTAEDGRVKIEVQLENEMWLTQQHMADLFQTTIQNINLHLQQKFEEKELQREAAVKESFQLNKKDDE